MKWEKHVYTYSKWLFWSKMWVHIKKHNEDDCVTKVLQLWAYFNAWIKKWGVEK